MKKIIYILVLLVSCYTTNAQFYRTPRNNGIINKQDAEKKKGFKKENLFIGGSATVNFFNGASILGVSPYLGYSLNKYLDVAASLNFNYTSQRDYNTYGDKLRETIFAPGAFARLYPVKFLFAQVGFEHNFIKENYFPSSSSPSTSFKFDANSTLVGGGYCIGRQGSGNPYYYVSVLFDVSGNTNSPYVDGLGRSIPIYKAGIQLPLSKKAHGGGYRQNRRY